jgi:hypothetical protein
MAKGSEEVKKKMSALIKKLDGGREAFSRAA